MKNAYKHFIKFAIKRGLTISVFDGEEWAVKRSTKQKDIIEAVESVEEANIRIRNKQGDIIANALVIPFGVEPDETMVDYSDNTFMHEWESEFD